MEDARNAAPASPSGDGPPYTVLVVEDDPAMREALREILLMSGFNVVATGDGLEANALALVGRYDVLLSDVRLPGLDGISLIRRLLQKDRLPPAILLTAYPDWKVFEEADHIGVATVLTKPVNLQQLALIVESVARGSRPAA